MVAALIRKLETAGGLTKDDERVLEAFGEPSHAFEARTDITSQGDRPENVHLITEGFAYRYKVLPDGKRHIMALLVPGDFCDLHVAILDQMDHSIATMTRCRVTTIPRAVINAVTHEHPRINRALWWATLVDEAVLREWLVNIGQRPSDQRLAHFFYELLLRLRLVGLADGDSCPMPIRQHDLADFFGLTSVHVNRSLQTLRALGLIVLEKRHLTIPEPERLMEFCGFDPSYLHFTPRINGSSVQ